MLDIYLYFGAHTFVHLKELCCKHGYRQFIFEGVSSDQALFAIFTRNLLLLPPHPNLPKKILVNFLYIQLKSLVERPNVK